MESQEETIMATAQAGKLGKPVMFRDPGVSGSIAIDERLDGGKMMRLLKPGDTIIAAKLDRLFRSARDALTTVDDLKERHIDVVLADIGNSPVTSNGPAKLFFQILAAVAEFERERIRERTLEGIKSKSDARKRDGVSRTGGPAPFGYKVEGDKKNTRLEPIPEQQAAIAVMVEMRKGGASLRDISAAMRDRGFNVSHTTVATIIHHEEERR